MYNKILILKTDGPKDLNEENEENKLYRDIAQSQCSNPPLTTYKEKLDTALGVWQKLISKINIKKDPVAHHVAIKNAQNIVNSMVRPSILAIRVKTKVRGELMDSSRKVGHNQETNQKLFDNYRKVNQINIWKYSPCQTKVRLISNG